MRHANRIETVKKVRAGICAYLLVGVRRGGKLFEVHICPSCGTVSVDKGLNVFLNGAKVKP